MSRTLRWTSESKRTFNQNLEYLAEGWNNQVINNFLDRVEEVLEKIKSNPELYPLHRPKDKVYKCVVHKRVVLYFRIVDTEHIDLLTFWNTYQNPDKLKV
jgi:plasmid stabilization system protein ParE